MCNAFVRKIFACNAFVRKTFVFKVFVRKTFVCKVFVRKMFAHKAFAAKEFLRNEFAYKVFASAGDGFRSLFPENFWFATGTPYDGAVHFLLNIGMIDDFWYD